MAKMMIGKAGIGDNLDGCICVLKSLTRERDGYRLVLADKSGELMGRLSDERFEPEMLKMVGAAVLLRAVVINGDQMNPVAKVKGIELAKEGSFRASDLFDGITPEKADAYRVIIKDCIDRIPDETMKILIEVMFTQKHLDRLAESPASISGHGKYRGGALAATAAVAKMATQEGVQYVRLANGLYEPSLDWSVLVAAALLHTAAIPKYLTDQPWRVTPLGIERGYMSLLQTEIETLIGRDKISVSEEQLSRLLNVLGCSVPMKTAVKATSAEGIILRHCLLLYEELDMLGAGLAEHEPKEGEISFYDANLRRFIPYSQRARERRSA